MQNTEQPFARSQPPHRPKTSWLAPGAILVAIAGTCTLWGAALKGSNRAAPGDAAPSTQEAASSQPSDWPCLAVWHDGGYRSKPNSGLKLAVWPDGTILFSPRREQLGHSLLTGTIEKADLEAMLKTIRAAGFVEPERNYVVPDSSYTTIAVQDAKGIAVRSFHEYLLPGFGGDINTDAKYRAFVRTWKQTSGAIEALAPIRVERLGERKEFRGYLVNKWHATEWTDGQKWKALSGK